MQGASSSGSGDSPQTRALKQTLEAMNTPDRAAEIANATCDRATQHADAAAAARGETPAVADVREAVRALRGDVMAAPAWDRREPIVDVLRRGVVRVGLVTENLHAEGRQP